MYAKLLIVFLTLVVAFYLQQYRVLSFGGVNPNLILIGFTLLIFKIARPKIFGALFFATVAVMLVLWSNWIFQISALVIVVASIYFIKKIFTGNRTLDFLVFIFLGTIFFYVIVAIAYPPFLSLELLLGEVVYNLIVGTALWFVFL